MRCVRPFGPLDTHGKGSREMTVFTAARKAELLARIARHEALDTIAQGAYAAVGGNGLLRVCAVGCAMVEPGDDPPHHDDWHRAMEDAWGIPAWLGELEDRVFEGLSSSEAKTWPRRFVASVPVNADLGQTLAHTLSALRLRQTVLPLAPTWPESVREQVTSAVQGMVDALESGGDPGSAESAAESAAWSAAELAARSAELAARSAAELAAWSAAELAAWSAAWSAAELAARSAELAARSAESAARSAESAARSAESAAWSAAWSARSAAWSAESARIINTLTSWDAS